MFLKIDVRCRLDTPIMRCRPSDSRWGSRIKAGARQHGSLSSVDSINDLDDCVSVTPFRSVLLCHY